MTAALIVSATASGSGKTLLTHVLARGLRSRGVRVAVVKLGPDYIDPRFHDTAWGGKTGNIDAFAMSVDEQADRLRELAKDYEFLLIEGVMGLYDGTQGGQGSTAHFARNLNIPVLSLLNVARQSHTAAALALGMQCHPDAPRLVGYVLNQVGSDRHQSLLEEAFLALTLPLYGSVRRNADLVIPSRHLGLVQAQEHRDFGFMSGELASKVDGQLDWPALMSSLSRGDFDVSLPGKSYNWRPVRPLGQRTAVAHDLAFSFCYPHLCRDWQHMGCEILPFSPIGDEAVPLCADSVYLPGGYPELHALAIAGCHTFASSLKAAALAGKFIYAECGGYMVLGESLCDSGGTIHKMLGLLPISTSIANPKRHLGYRRLQALDPTPMGQYFTAHEFHYASVIHESMEPNLFSIKFADGTPGGLIGHRTGNIAGSFAHIIAAQNADELSQ